MSKRKPQHWKQGWTKSEKRRWWERIEHIQEALDLGRSVQVGRVPMKKNDGDFLNVDACYRIRISNTLDYQAAVCTLLHEFAHALEPYDEHGQAFHAAQCEVWSANTDWEENYA